MERPVVISVSPHKKNIMYIVQEKTTMADIVHTISQAIHHHGVAKPRIFLQAIRGMLPNMVHYRLVYTLHGE